MTEVFVSYARPNVVLAAAMADLLRARGFGVWRDDDLPPHRAFGDVIEERLRAARAVLVLWSADAAKSHWVRAEAELARQLGTLVQATLDGSPLPLPFSQVQCADLVGWRGDDDAAVLRKLLESIAELAGRDCGTDAAPRSRLETPPGQGGGARPDQRPTVNVAESGPQTPPGQGGGARPDPRPTVNVAESGPQTPLGRDLVADIRATLGRHAGLVLSANEQDNRADYRLEISAREAGTRARIVARLLARADGQQVWSERFDGDATDPLALLDQVGEAVSAGVEALLRRAGISAALSATADDGRGRLSAAMAAVNRMDAAGYRAALEILAAETASDDAEPDALALAALAHACLWTNGFAGSDSRSAEQGRMLALKALRQTDSAPFVAGLSAVALAMLGGPSAASQAITDRVQAMHPGFAPALLWAGQVRLLAGDAAEAVSRLEAAQRLDPQMTVRPLLLGWLGAARLAAGQLEPARTALEEATALAEGLPMNRLLLAAVLGLLGRREEGRAALQEALALAPPDDFRLPLPPGLRQQLRDGLTALD